MKPASILALVVLLGSLGACYHESQIQPIKGGPEDALAEDASGEAACRGACQGIVQCQLSLPFHPDPEAPGCQGACEASTSHQQQACLAQAGLQCNLLAGCFGQTWTPSDACGGEYPGSWCFDQLSQDLLSQDLPSLEDYYISEEDLTFEVEPWPDFGGKDEGGLFYPDTPADCSLETLTAEACLQGVEQTVYLGQLASGTLCYEACHQQGQGAEMVNVSYAVCNKVGYCFCCNYFG